MTEYYGPTPLATVNRLSIYLRTLEEAQSEGHKYISSKSIAERNGLTSAQVRKDLSCFGNFGRKGKGYHIQSLIQRIRSILGINRKWNVAIVGLGHLGEALAGYKGFQRSGFDIVAIFDIDENKIGKKYNGIPIFHPDDMKKVINRKNIQIAIISVPASAAKNSIEKLVDAGIEGILNFTDVRVSTKDEFVIKNVNLAGELETIAYYITRPDWQCRGI